MVSQTFTYATNSIRIADSLAKQRPQYRHAIRSKALEIIVQVGDGATLVQPGEIVTKDIVKGVRTRPDYVGTFFSYYLVRNIQIFEESEYKERSKVNANPANGVTLSIFVSLLTCAFLAIAEAYARYLMSFAREPERDFPQAAIAIVNDISIRVLPFR